MTEQILVEEHPRCVTTEGGPLDEIRRVLDRMDACPAEPDLDPAELAALKSVISLVRRVRAQTRFAGVELNPELLRLAERVEPEWLAA